MTWRRVPLRAVAEVSLGRQRSPEHDSGEHVVPYLRAANVKDAVLDLDDVKEMNFTPAEQAVFALRPGDVLVSEGSGSLTSVGAAATWIGQLPGTVCFQNTLLRLRPREDTLLPEYLAYWARACFGSGLFAAIAAGANIYHLSAERLRALPIRVPALAAQRAVVAHLDQQLAEMAATESALHRTRNLLAERRWVAFGRLISQTIAPVVQLRRVILHLTDGPFGSAFSSSDYTDTGAAVVRLGNIGFAEYRSTAQAYVSEDLFRRLRRHEVLAGDLLIAGLGDARNHAGRACVAPDLGPAIVKGKCFCGRVDESKASAEYIAAVLSSPIGIDALSGAGRGSTRSMINLEIVKSTGIPLPDIGVQQELMRTFVAAQSDERAALAALDRQLQLLAERRRILISEAVSGKLDVGAAA